MAVAQTMPLRDIISIIPEFNGKNIPLSLFFVGCDEALELIDEDNERNLTRLIRSKITGEARKSILGQTFETIESLKDYLKSIYAPLKTVQQLQGEIGNEYQRDEENVISFANRIRDIQQSIIEAQKVNNGSVSPDFETTVKQNSVECFKNGLKPEIERKLENANDLNNIVKNAIKAERLLEAQKLLRNPKMQLTESSSKNKKAYSCQIENKECQRL